VSGRETALQRARLFREVLLDHGVPEVSIELQPGRPSPGDVWNSLDPVMATGHHIASHPTPDNPTPGLRLVKGGRSDLGAPLCNGHAGVDLVYRILCMGWANHPGLGGPLTVRGPLGAFTIPKDNARPYSWGTEYEGGFTDEVWDRVYVNRRTGKRMDFHEFMGRCNAGIVEAIWLPGISSRGLYDRITPGMDLSGYHGEHKTWAPTRKVDRRGYTTESGRAEIRRFSTTNREEDDMFEKEDRDRLKRIEAAIKKDHEADRLRDLRLARNLSRRLNATEADVLAAIAEAKGDEAGAPGEG
jgi:hypothetical protein